MAPRGVPWPGGVKVKVTRWAGTENLLTRCTLGLVTEVYLDPGVYRGPGGQGQGEGQGQGHMLELLIYHY